MIRVAFAITELEVGGAERCLANLVTRLDRRRFEPLVISLAPRPRGVGSRLGEAPCGPFRQTTPDPFSCDALVRQLEAAGVPVRFVGVSSRWRMLAAIWQTRRLLAEFQPDVLQTFLFHANVIGSLAARQLVPRVVTGIRVADPAKWRHWVERWATRRAERIVCVSEAVAEFAAGSMGLPRQKLLSIPNSIDIENYPAPRFDLTSFGVPAGARVLTFIGRLARQKGVDWLLRLLPSLFASLPGWHLLLVGEGPDRPMLERLAAELGLSSRVHFAGWRPEVPEILAASDLFVLPSRWEGMPNVLLQAMATGLPVVSTPVEGVFEVLGPLAAEQTARPGDADDFQKKIVRLAIDAKLTRSLGEQNRARVSESFSLAKMVGRYEQVYSPTEVP